MSLAPRPTYLATNSAVDLGSKLAGGLQQPRPNRISLKDDRFTLILESGQTPVPPSLTLQVIFVGGNPHASRVYYDSDSYDPENSDAPVCWSDNGIGPSEKSSQPQAPTCGQCPKSAWGSAVSKMTGKGIPACSTRKKVAVLVAGAGSDVFLLDIPSASLKPFGLYMARLGGELHASPEEVVTEITMVNKELAFRELSWLPESMLPAVAQIVASDAPDMVVGAHDRPGQVRLPSSAPIREAIAAPYPQQPSTEMQPDPFALMYPKGPVAEQVFDERNPPLPGPMTSQEAEAANGGKPPRKPRADKGVPRKQETVVGPGPIPAQTFAAPQAAPASFIQPTAPAPSFGMQAQPATPPTEVADMLSKAFGLRIGQ